MRPALLSTAIVLACGTAPSEPLPAPTAARAAAQTAGPDHHLAFGDTRACARTPDAGVACWTLGDRPGTAGLARIAGLERVQDVAMSSDTLLVVREGGRLWRQDGDGSAVAIRGGIRAVDAYAGYACVLDGGGTVSCWGELGSDLEPATPTPIPGVPALVDLDVGGYIACGRTDAGAVWCWGWGNGKGPARVALRRPAAALAAGNDFACAVFDDGSVDCWNMPFTEHPETVGCRSVERLYDAQPPSWSWEDCPAQPLAGVRDVAAVVPAGGVLILQSRDGSVATWNPVSPVLLPAVHGLRGLAARFVPDGLELCGWSSTGALTCARDPPVVPPDAATGPWRVRLP